MRRIMAAAPADALNLAIGELTYPLPKALAEYARELLLTETPRYTPNAGLSTLRDHVAAYYDFRIDASQVCITNGAEEALYITLTALVNDRDLIAIPDPDYPAYPAIAAMVNARIVRLPYEPDLISIDWERWEKLLSTGVKICLFSHPANPHGRYFQDDEINRLIDLCESYGIVLIVDEIYRELYFKRKPASFAGRYDRLIVVGGVSKSHCMSGWRIGWIISPPSFAGSVIKTRQYISTCSNWLSQMLAVFALSPEGMTLVETIRQRLRLSHKLAIKYIGDKIPNLFVHTPNASPYLMINIGEDDIVYATRLAQTGIITAPGSAFGMVTNGWIRINASALDCPC